DNFSAARRNVAEDPWYVSARDKLIDDRLGKAVRVSRERALQNNAGHFPVTSSGVFTVRSQCAFAVTPTGFLDRRNSFERTNVAEPEALQIRQAHFARFTDVAERVRPGVTPFWGVGHGTDTGAVEDY